MKRQILAVSILLVAVQLFGQESRFWVGGSGKWNDANHWSTVSGGEPGATVPESGTSVVFDANSFSESQNTVTLKEDVVIGSLTATDAKFVFSGKKSFAVEGSINTDANADFGKLRGTLVLSGNGSNTVNIASELEGGIIIDGGNWTLESDLTTQGDITLKSGSFNTAGHNVSCAVFSATESATALNIENSTVTCDKWDLGVASNLTFEANGSQILIRDDFFKNFLSARNLKYNLIRSYDPTASKSDPTPTLDLDPIHVSCPSNADNLVNDGGVKVTVDGGTGDYNLVLGYLDAVSHEFVWMDEFFGNSHPFGNLEAGSYSAGFSPDGKKVTIQTVNVDYANPDFTLSIGVKKDAVCWGDDLELGYTASGGTGEGTYSQQWRKTGYLGVFSSAEQISAAPQATYTVTIIDGRGCKFASNTFKYTPWWRELGQNDSYSGGPARIIGEASAEETCSNKETGVITVSNVSGGTAPYSYSAELNGTTYNFPSGETSLGDLPAGEYTITITDNEGCTDRSNFATVFADDPSEAPEEIKTEITTIPAPEANAGSDDKVCLQEGTYTVSKENGVEAKNHSKGTILWTVDDPSIATIASGADTETPTLTLLDAGTVKLTMKVTNGTCDPVEDYMTLTVIATPKPSITSTDHPVCGLADDIEAVASMSGTLVADRIGGTGTGNVTINNLHVEVDEPGEYIFRVIETEPDNDCVGYSNSDGDGVHKTVTLNFYNQPTVSFTPDNGNTCGVTPVTLKPTIANEESISWSHNGKGNLVESADSKSATYTPSTLDADNDVIVTVTVGNGVCPSKNAAYTITVKPVPTVSINPIGAGTKGDVCGLSGIIATAVPSHGGELTWDNGGDDTFIVIPESATTATLQGDNGVTYGLTVKEEKDGCMSDPSPVVYVTFHANPTLSLSDPDDVCGTDPATATATATNNTGLIWSKDNAVYKGSLEQSGDASSMTATYTPAASDAGKDVTLTATITTAACGTLTQDYTFHVYEVPSPTLAGKEICGPEDDGYLTATIESGNTVEWKIPSGVRKVEEVIEGTEAKVKLALTGTTYGDYTIGVVESNTNCSSKEVTAKVTFKAKPVMEFEEYTATICTGDSYTVKVKTHENYTNYIWSASDGGTIDMGSNAGTYNSVASTFGKRVTITAIPTGGCTSEGAQSMTLTVNPTPAPVIDDVTVCGMDYTLPTPVESVTFDPITYPDHPSSDFAWSTPDVSGKAHVSGGKFTATEEGTYTLRLAEMVGSCQQYDEAEITFVAKPTANAGADDAVCFNEPSYDLNATAENHAGLEWSSPTAGVFAIDDLTPTYIFTDDDRANGSVTLTLKAKANTPCKSTDDYESKITITINPLPTPVVGGDNNICQNETGNYSTESGKSDYKWYIDDVEQSGSSNTFSHKWETAGTFNVKVEYKDGNGCKGVSLAFPVTVRDLPVSGLVSSDNTCTNSIGLSLDATATGGSGSYSYAWTGNGAEYLNSQTIAAPIFKSDVAGTYTLTCTITDTDPDYGCSISPSITIENEQGPTVNAGPDTTICYSGTYTLFNGVEFANGTTIEWSTDGDGDFDDKTLLNATYKPGDVDKLNGEVHLTLTVNSDNCGSISDQMTLSIMPELTIGIGTLKPFPIASSTKIRVRVKGNYATAYGIQFYLVSPDGAHKVKLYNHTLDHNNSMKRWVSEACDFDFVFTTESNDDFFNIMKSWDFGNTVHNVSGTFGITGDWSEIYGLNPAEGGWAVEVGSDFSDGVGKLAHAEISFTDVNFEGKTQTLTFDSKELNPNVSIPNTHTISYISPIGLRESCYGMCDAHAVANALGGSGKIVKWEWARDINFTEDYVVGGTDNRDTLDLCRGIYYVRATDAKGCEAVTMVEVGSPDKIHINNDALADAKCYGNSDGLAEFSATKENVTNFSFAVDGFTPEVLSVNSARFNDLPFGEKYKLIVTDEDGCQDSTTFDIGQPDTLMVTNITIVEATSCEPGVYNGSVTFTVTGGKEEGNYVLEYIGNDIFQPAYSISGLTASNLAANGNVQFRIRDGVNPTVCYLDTSISTLSDPMKLSIDSTLNTCYGLNEASITVTVSNGSGDYKYVWSDANGIIAGQESATATGLKGGTYTVTVTDNESKCPITSKPIVLVDPDSISFAKPVFTEAIKCYGDETASFTVEVSGGTDGLTYSWNTGATTNGLTAVGAGSYVLTATDGNFCSKDTTIVISAPESALVIVNDTVITTESECGGATGTAAIIVEGGVGPYTYNWYLQSDTDNTIAANASAVANLSVEQYVVEVVDALGCTVSKEFSIQDEGNVDFDWTITKELLCVGNTDGEAKITKVNGYDEDGKVIMIYDVAKITWENLGTGETGTGNTIINLGYGDNKIMVIADDGCRSVKNVEIDETNSNVLRVANPISYPDQFGNGNCDGSIKATITGGVPGYSYVWTNEAGDEVDAGTAGEEVTTVITSLCEGEYTLTVVDNNEEGACTLIETIKVEFSPLSFSEVRHDDVTCYGGDNGILKITGVDGYPSEEYQYEWTSSQWPAGTVVTGDSIGGLTAGWYKFTVSQRNNRRKVIDSLKITQPSNRLHIPDAYVSTKPSHCYDSIGDIQIYEPANLAEAFGGNTPFTYTFSHEGWATDSVKNPGEDPWITKLPIGDYNLLVEDDLGCKFDTVIEVPDMSKFTVKIVEQKDPRCYGDDNGSIKIEASSENGGFTYSWNTGATTNEITKLSEGTYTVTVVDNMNCKKIVPVDLTWPLKVSFSVSSSLVDCYNSADGGEITISKLQGGWNKYNLFEFIDEAGDIYEHEQTVDTSVVVFSNLLAAGNYKVRVTDVSNCQSDLVSLSVGSKYPELKVSVQERVEPDCYEFTTDGNLSFGSITILTGLGQVSSTTINLDRFYQIDDSPIQENSKFQNVVAGPHTITVGFTDSLVCPVVILDTLNSKNNLKANARFSNGAKSIFTCPDNELTAYVTAPKSFNYKFYTLTDEDAEKMEIAKPAPAPAKAEPANPADNTVTNDTVNTADSANAVAYRFNRGIYFRADSVPTNDSLTAADSVVPEVELPTYDHTAIRGRNVTMFAQGSSTDKNDAWADKFKPYGRETFYYFEVNDNVCISVDSIKATSLRPVEKLHAVVDMEDAKFIGTMYQVPEGRDLTLIANQLEFEFSENIFAFADNGWLWQSAPLDGNPTSGLTDAPERGIVLVKANENPLVAQAYGKFVAKVWDSVRFELSDDTEGVYHISDTSMTCSYYDSVLINSDSRIKPMQVFTPNGDGKNDTWGISGLESYDKATIYVFNRWGGRVWQYSGAGSDYSANEWNGRNEKNKPVPSGTYYYVIQCSDGHLGGKKVTGPVTVIR